MGNYLEACYNADTRVEGLSACKVDKITHSSLQRKRVVPEDIKPRQPHDALCTAGSHLSAQHEEPPLFTQRVEHQVHYRDRPGKHSLESQYQAYPRGNARFESRDCLPNVQDQYILKQLKSMKRFKQNYEEQEVVN